MPKKSVIWFLLGVCLAALEAPALPVQAKTLPLVNPKPNDPTDPISCWQWFDMATTTAGLKRVCSGTYAVDFALPLDYAGTYQVYVTGTIPSTNSQLNCQTIKITPTGGYVFGTNVYLRTVSSQFQYMDLGTVQIDAGDSLFLRCMVRTGARILNVDYFPT